MNDIEKRKLADQADMIVNGYAYTHTAQDFRVCNLNSEHCAVFSPTCEMLETNMDNIELHIARHTDKVAFTMFGQRIGLFTKSNHAQPESSLSVI